MGSAKSALQTEPGKGVPKRHHPYGNTKISVPERAPYGPQRGSRMVASRIDTVGDPHGHPLRAHYVPQLSGPLQGDPYKGPHPEGRHSKLAPSGTPKGARIKGAHIQRHPADRDDMNGLSQNITPKGPHGAPEGPQQCPPKVAP